MDLYYQTSSQELAFVSSWMKYLEQNQSLSAAQYSTNCNTGTARAADWWSKEMTPCTKDLLRDDIDPIEERHMTFLPKQTIQKEVSDFGFYWAPNGPQHWEIERMFGQRLTEHAKSTQCYNWSSLAMKPSQHQSFIDALKFTKHQGIALRTSACFRIAHILARSWRTC